MLPLDRLSHGVLDANPRSAKLHAFKRASSDRLATGGATVDAVLRLAPGRGMQLLTRSYALTRGPCQLSRPYEDRTDDASASPPAPSPAPMSPNFDHELREALGEYWRGALASP